MSETGDLKPAEPTTPPRASVIIHTVYFPPAAGGAALFGGQPRALEIARRLGETLYGLLCRPEAEPLAPYTGITVRVGTHDDRVDLDEADRIIVIPILGGASHGSAATQTRVLARLEAWHGRGNTTVLPVRISDKWRASEGRLPTHPLPMTLGGGDTPPASELNRLLLSVGRALSGGEDLHLKLFISYANADAEVTGGAAEQIYRYVIGDVSGKAFFDKGCLRTGEGLSGQIDANAGQGVFVLVRSDHYSARAWCERELLVAKRRRLPILIVEVLEGGEARSSAYAGNGPTHVWTEEGGAARVVTLAMVEAIKSLAFSREVGPRLASLAGLPEDGTLLLSRPPELLDLAYLSASHRGPLAIVHPDPEVSIHARAVLSAARPDLRLITPTTAFRRNLGATALRTPLAGLQVAFSLSKSPDVGGADGLTEAHVVDATTFMCRALITAGAGIAYGGDLRPQGYTHHLTDLIAAYNQGGQTSGELLHAYMAAPLDPQEEEGPAFTLHHLGIPEEGFRPLLEPPPGRLGDLPEHRKGLYFSDMRRAMERCIDGRVLLGGQANPQDEGRLGYLGRYPGILEEAWRGLKEEHPLYIIGGFGGAAGLLVALITEGDIPPRLREETWAQGPRFGALMKALEGDRDVQRLGLSPTQEAMARETRALLRERLSSDASAEAWNGLNRAENRRLFTSTDPLVLSSLVLKGLLRLVAERARGELRIEVVRGSVTTPSGLELLAFPVLDDTPLRGAGLAIERLAPGDGIRAQAHPDGLSAVRSDALDAEYLLAVGLGDLQRAVDDPVAAVERAARRVRSEASRHGFTRVGVVTLWGTLSDGHEDLIRAMVAELRGLPDDVEVIWFEDDPERAEGLIETLSVLENVHHTVRIPAMAEDVAPHGGGREAVLNIRRAQDLLDILLLPPQATGIASTHEAVLDEAEHFRLSRGSQKVAPWGHELDRLGRQISRLLFKQNAGRVLEACGVAPMVVVHDIDASGIPYEAMAADDGEGGLLRPALMGGMTRRLQLTGHPLHATLQRPPRRGKLKALLVALTEGLPSVAKEAAAVEAALTSLSGRVDLQILRDGEATREGVREILEGNDLDLFHFCGHGYYDGPGLDQSGLVLTGSGRLTFSDLSRLEEAPRVVFFNACEAGRVRNLPEETVEVQALAEWFLRAGAQAFLGTFWKVEDTHAGTFAEAIYGALCGGETLGAAVLAGRRRLFEAESSDWSNYILYGDGDFQLVRRSHT